MRSHVVTLTRGWARVEVDGKAVVLEAPVRVEQGRWLVPEAFMRQVMPMLEARAPAPPAEPPKPAAAPPTGGPTEVGQVGRPGDRGEDDSRIVQTGGAHTRGDRDGTAEAGGSDDRSEDARAGAGGGADDEGTRGPEGGAPRDGDRGPEPAGP